MNAAPLLVVALLAATAADGRLSQAESLAKKRETDAAADVYRALLRDGVGGAGVEYNLGTLCLEQGRTGEAVLHLLTAARAAPRDSDVRHNLAVALDTRADRLAGDAPADPVKSIGTHTPPGAARLALALPLAILGLLLAALAYVDVERARSLIRYGVVVAVVAVVAGAATFACRKSVEATRVAVVIAPEAPALKDADDAAATSFIAHAGLYGDVVEENAGFVRIRFENGLEAWMRSAGLGFIE